MAKRRITISTPVQTEVLVKSGRRCCLCFGLDADIKMKAGQIAHLDHNPANNKPDNLAWLCLSHHDIYDSVSRQTKRLTSQEVKSHRESLYFQLSVLASKSGGERTKRARKNKPDRVLDVLYRYSYSDEATTKVISAEILTRIEQIYQYCSAARRVFDSMEREKLTDDEKDQRYDREIKEIRERLMLPIGIWGLNGEGTLPYIWKKCADRLAKKWIRGSLSYDECIDIAWTFDEEYDLDLHYILYGLPNRSLSALEIRALYAFVYEHG